MYIPEAPRNLLGGPPKRWLRGDFHKEETAIRPTQGHMEEKKEENPYPK